MSVSCVILYTVPFCTLVGVFGVSWQRDVAATTSVTGIQFN